MIISKILILIISGFLLIAAGSYAIYPVYLNSLALRFKFSSSQINLFSSFIDFGYFIALPMGFIYDKYGHKLSLILSGVILPGAYLILNKLMTDKPESHGLFPFLIIGFLLGQGSVLLKITTLSINLKNFKFKDSSPMVGLLLSNMAISASIFTSYKKEALPLITIEAFFKYIAIFILICVTIAFIFFKDIGNSQKEYSDFDQFKEKKMIIILIWFNIGILCLYVFGLIINNITGSTKIPNFIIFPILKTLNFIVIILEIYKYWDEDIFKKYIEKETIKEQIKWAKSVMKEGKDQNLNKTDLNNNNLIPVSIKEINNNLKEQFINDKVVKVEENNNNNNNNINVNCLDKEEIKEENKIEDDRDKKFYNSLDPKVIKYLNDKEKKKSIIEPNSNSILQNIGNFGKNIKNNLISIVDINDDSISKISNNTDIGEEDEKPTIFNNNFNEYGIKSIEIRNNNDEYINEKEINLECDKDLNDKVIYKEMNKTNKNEHENVEKIENKNVINKNIQSLKSSQNFMIDNSDNLNNSYIDRNRNEISEIHITEENRSVRAKHILNINDENIDAKIKKSKSKKIEDENKKENELILKNAINELNVLHVETATVSIEFMEIIKTSSIWTLFFIQVLSEGIIYSTLNNITYVVKSLSPIDISQEKLETSIYDYVIMYFVFNSFARIIVGMAISNYIKQNNFYWWIVMVTSIMFVSQAINLFMNRVLLIISISLLGIVQAGLTTFTTMFVRIEYGLDNLGKIIGLLYIGNAVGTLIICNLIFISFYNHYTTDEVECHGKRCFLGGYIINTVLSAIAVLLSLYLYRLFRKSKKKNSQISKNNQNVIQDNTQLNDIATQNINVLNQKVEDNTQLNDVINENKQDEIIKNENIVNIEISDPNNKEQENNKIIENKDSDKCEIKIDNHQINEKEIEQESKPIQNFNEKTNSNIVIIEDHTNNNSDYNNEKSKMGEEENNQNI